MADQGAGITVAAAPATVVAPASAGAADTGAVDTGVGIEGAEGTAEAPAITPVETDDPDFEFESEIQDQQGQKIKQSQKVKTSVVKKYLARAQELERREAAMQEYYQKQVVPLDQMMQSIRQDPAQLFEFARKMGIDPAQAADIYVKQAIEQANMTPEQRELQQHKRELEQYKAQEKQRQEYEQRTAYQQEVTRQSNLITQNLSRAAQAAGLPDDPAIHMAMTGHLRAQFQEGRRPNFEEAAAYAKKMLYGGQKASIAKLTYEELAQQYPELLTTVRNGDILKSKVPGARVPKAQAAKPQNQGPSNYSAEDYAEKMRNGG